MSTAQMHFNKEIKNSNEKKISKQALADVKICLTLGFHAYSPNEQHSALLYNLLYNSTTNS